MESLFDLVGFLLYCLFAYTIQRIENEFVIIWLIITGNYEENKRMG